MADSYLLKDVTLPANGGFILQENSDQIILDELAGPTIGNAVALTKPNILDQTGGGSMVPIATIGYAWLTWPATALGGAFGYYEIRRLGQHEGSIAQITSESGNHFADFTLPRNTVTTYALRIVRSDGTPTAYTNFPTVTVPMDKCVVTLANNTDPDQAFACQDATPYDWQFSHEDRVVLHDIFGRNTPMGFRPAEPGGDQFTRLLYIAGQGANRTNAPAGRRLLQPVLDLIRNPIFPYVAFCDADGWTWLTTARVDATRRSEPGGVYTATVSMTETSDELSPVVTDDPWAP